MLLILTLLFLQAAHAQSPIFWVDSNSVGSVICREVLKTEHFRIDAKPLIYEELQKNGLLERAPQAGELEVLSDYFLAQAHPLVSRFGTYLQLLSRADSDDPTQRTQIDRAHSLASRYFTHWFRPPRDGLTIPAAFGISQSGTPVALKFETRQSLRRFFQHDGKAWFDRWKIKKLFLRSDPTTLLDESYTPQDVELLKSLPSLEEIEYSPHYLEPALDLDNVVPRVLAVQTFLSFAQQGMQVVIGPRPLTYVIFPRK